MSDNVNEPRDYEASGLPILRAIGSQANQDHYVRILANMYRSAPRLWDPDYALANDPDPLEKLMLDPVMAQAIQLRLSGVAGRSWRVLPGDDTPESMKLAGITEKALRHITRFDQARRLQAQAVLLGRSFSYICGKRKNVVLDDIPGPWWIPVQLEQVDRRRFRWVPFRDQATGKYGRRLEIYNFHEEFPDWQPVKDSSLFMQSVYADEESRLGQGRGALQSAYFFGWAKTELIKLALQGAERWAHGILVANVDGLRKSSKTNAEIGSDYLEVFEEQQSRHMFVVDKEDDLTVLTGGNEGHQIVKDLLTYMDGAITRLFLGAELPFGGREGFGSWARADTELEVSNRMITDDKAALDEDITRDLIGKFLERNYGVLRMHGLHNAARPEFSSAAQASDDPQIVAAVVNQLAQANVPLSAKEVRGRCGFSDPTPGEEVTSTVATGMPTEDGDDGLNNLAKGNVPKESEVD